MSEISRYPCPYCGRKGLHYAGHPHALGVKDHYRAACRFCQRRFKIIYERTGHIDTITPLPAVEKGMSALDEFLVAGRTQGIPLKSYPEFLELADAAAVELDALQERVRVMEGAARAVLDEIAVIDRGTTHYEGCEDDHPRCRWAKRLAAALGQP